MVFHRFPKLVAPIGQTFRRIAARLEHTGTTGALAGRGRHRTGRLAENIAVLAADDAENEETSTRQHGQDKRFLQLELDEQSLANMWFQQDGVTLHQPQWIL